MSPRVEKQTSALRKAATVVVSLGVETASEVFKYLHEDEIEKLTTEIATMPALSADEVETTMEEFYNLCLAQTYICLLYTSHFFNAPCSVIDGVVYSLAVIFVGKIIMVVERPFRIKDVKISPSEVFFLNIRCNIAIIVADSFGRFGGIQSTVSWLLHFFGSCLLYTSRCV